MDRKPQITASVPEHIHSEIAAHATALEISKAEYVGLIIKWWYGQNSPPVTLDEERLKKENVKEKR